MPTFTENIQLALGDPTGTKRQQLAAAIVSLPARARAIAGMKSAIVAKLNQGAKREDCAAAWQAVTAAQNKVLELDKWVRAVWQTAKNRGEVSGSIPEITIAEPDRPQLSGFTTIVAIAAAAATAIAAFIFLVGPALVAGLTIAAVLAIAAAISAAVDLAQEKTAQLRVAAASPNVLPALTSSPAGDIASAISSPLVLIGLASLAVFALSRRRK